MSLEGLAAKAEACLELRTEVPGAPGWDEEVIDASVSFELIQNTVDYLACKAQIEMPLLDDEKIFMKTLFEDLWGSGQYSNYKEAAALANHYVNGDGQHISIVDWAFKRSVIVKDAMNALKAYIRELANKNKSYTLLKSNDLLFLHSGHANAMQRADRSRFVHGHMLNTGELVAEESNRDLVSVLPQFCLHVRTSRATPEQAFMSTWKVAGRYDFNVSSATNSVHDVFISGNFNLRLPDGLAQYLARSGVAKEFDYHAEWHDAWS